MSKTRSLALLIALPALSCATPGSRPHEMSSSQHEATAKQEDKAAAGHAGQYDSKATVTSRRCRPATTEEKDGTFPDVCWDSYANPTDAHRREAEEHRRRAADHRKGSAALREAEPRACAGIDADDRDISPFEHVGDITSVVPLKVPEAGRGKLPIEQVAGAVVTFRAVPGMTVEWLQRVVDCHLARNASMGHNASEMPNCPLVPKAVTATVSSIGGGFAVSIRSNDPATAREILARAQRLTTSQGPTSSTR